MEQLTKWRKRVYLSILITLPLGIFSLLVGSILSHYFSMEFVFTPMLIISLSLFSIDILAYRVLSSIDIAIKTYKPRENERKLSSN